MATHDGARTHNGLGAGGVGARARRRLRLAPPLFFALAVLASMPGLALAGGGGASVAVSPASGPDGTQVTVTGSNFTSGDQVQVGYAAGNCSSGVVIITGATGTAQSNGTVTVVLVWPGTGVGSYHVCVIDKTNGHTYSSSNQFSVTSATAPSITVSTPVTSGQPVTVKGSNFKVSGGGTVEISYGPGGSNGCATSAGTAPLNPDGTFTFTFNAPFESSNTQITITAVYPQGACSGNWILRASKTVTVEAATATPTPSPTATKSLIQPTATPTPSTVGIAFPPTFPPTPAETVVYCLVGLLVLLLLLLLFLLLSRNRRQNEPATIRQQDTPLVNAGQGRAGAPMVQSSIYAENPRNQRRTQIAEEITSIQEEPINPPNPKSGGGTYGPPRFGPATGGPNQSPQ